MGHCYSFPNSEEHLQALEEIVTITTVAASSSATRLWRGGEYSRNPFVSMRKNNSEEGDMKPDMEKETPESRNLSRREVLNLIGATVAASLVVGIGEQSASAQQLSASTQNMKSRIV